MNQHNLSNRATATLKLAANLRASKGLEYSSEQDALANFKEANLRYDVHSEIVAGILLDKQLASIHKHIRQRQKGVPPTGTEPFQERIADAINYLLFLDALEYEFLHSTVPNQTDGGSLISTEVKDV